MAQRIPVSPAGVFPAPPINCPPPTAPFWPESVVLLLYSGRVFSCVCVCLCPTTHTKWRHLAAGALINVLSRNNISIGKQQHRRVGITIQTHRQCTNTLKETDIYEIIYFLIFLRPITFCSSMKYYKKGRFGSAPL